jgi:hypothetical protein
MKTTLLAAALIAAGAGSVAQNAAAAAFVVSFEGEAAGVQNTTATFSTGGVETFDTRPVHTYPQSFTTNFGTSGAGSTITGTYAAGSGNGIQINSADQYGGAGGNGNYAVAFQNTPYSLTLTSNIAGGVNYFGFWLSALDRGNFVTFYGNGGQKLFTFNPQDVINAVQHSANSSQYYGNPNSPYRPDGGEPFIFVNFFDTTGSFSKVSFSEVNSGGGYESDNHTVGHYLTMGQGTNVALQFSAAAPEPATWAMMLLGFGGLGFAGYRRSRKDVATTVRA